MNINRYWPKMALWVYLFYHDLQIGINRLHTPADDSVLDVFVWVGIFLLVICFLLLFRFKKGRVFLRSLPIKAVQQRALEPGEPGEYDPPYLPWLIIAGLQIITGIQYWFFQQEQPIFTFPVLHAFIWAGCTLLFAGYRILVYTDKGRAFLAKLPFKFIKRRLDQFK